MTIIKHSWLDVPRWCTVIHYHGDRSEDVLKYILLASGVKTWQKDIEVDKFIQEIDMEQYISVDKNKKLGVLDARQLKDHKNLLKAIKLVNKLGLKAFVHTDLDKEGNGCLGRSHIAIRTTKVDDDSSTVHVFYKHLKHGDINKEYTLKHTNGTLELIHVKDQE